MAHPAIAVQSPQVITPSSDALWYKDAIIYQLHVRAFHDSNGDGVGDFRGLTQKLDYIQDLGVTALWMLPVFPSPLKDDGYDIADYTTVNPQYGTLEDFQALLEEAHRRDLKVITELVMNHTSDQHAWFQRARRAAVGSPYRDWYVWSDSPDKYQEARIIFEDFETSNWSWDPVANAYFWHRFYHHQPDLNFDNPEVCQAMFDTLDFWLSMGVDGLRLDAVPYLFEREGTNCENLPETHEFLRRLRLHVEEKHDGKMLLAEANQWPEDAAAYFGDGDECHMNFHFPLMPRLFMAVEREDRFPVVDILDQTPLLPENCQWAIFLRNHDELTLEMVTDEERDYMYRTYAVDSHARINLGIRRRLAPLMRNNRRKIELMNGLLLSLPGSPIIYYGDEIGMGDNFYLGDRNGVRTPMQWNGDRNAGFSAANPQSLYLPVIIDPEYHYGFRNVEVEQASPHSLLWWMRRILDLRKQFQAFGRGSFTPLTPENPKVLAFLRETEEETILVVANLSRFSQYAELDLSRFRGHTPTELFGEVNFPPIGELPYLLALGPHAFFWFRLAWGEAAAADASLTELPTCHIRAGEQDLLKGRLRAGLRETLPNFLRRHRWFAGKARMIQSLEVVDAFAVKSAHTTTDLQLILVQVNYAEGEPDAYLIPVVLATRERAEEILADHPAAGIMRIEDPQADELSTLCEATRERELWQTLLAAIGQRKKIQGQHGVLRGLNVPGISVDLERADERPPQVHGGEQSNTSAIFDDQYILKLFRRVTPGVNPDFEMGVRLTEQGLIEHVPKVLGALEYRSGDGGVMTLAILHEFVPNEGDAWTYTLDEVSRYYERMQSASPDPQTLLATRHESSSLPQQVDRLSFPPSAEGNDDSLSPINGPPARQTSILQLAASEPSVLATEMVGGYLHSAERLGQRTGELHVALAQFEDEEFRPEAFTSLYQRSLYQAMRNQTRSSMDLLRAQLPLLEEENQRKAQHLMLHEGKILGQFGQLMRQKIAAKRLRCHGDYHLGQVLFTGKDFVIIDFEGEPERYVSERRIKVSPLRDVAGMLRSLHYASHARVLGQTSSMRLRPEALETADAVANFWYQWAAASFLRGYLAATRDVDFLPRDPSHLETLLNVYLMEKALYELRYELNNRPSWVKIPLEGIQQLLD